VFWRCCTGVKIVVEHEDLGAAELFSVYGRVADFEE
jgi:hypothetical protein